MEGRVMATPSTASTRFWQKLRRGHWGKPVADRIEAALDALTCRLRGDDGIRALIVFGSYARGDFSRKSDLDLLVLLGPGLTTEARDQVERRITSMAVAIETEARLPVHLAPLIADVGNPSELGASLLHELWTDGVILFG